MGFASAYLEERAVFPVLFNEAPDKQTGIIVVIPAYNEPGILRVLDSLASCSEPSCKVEVMVIVNAPPDANEDSLTGNIQTVEDIEGWKTKNDKCFFRLLIFMAGWSTMKDWGVGLARKTGMDEAARRFDQIDNSEGIILNLDADCLVENNYFVSVYSELYGRSSRAACSIYFEHPLSGDEYNQNIYRYITLYELHLRYYYQALVFSGFQYVFHTVGSAIAVKASQYVRAGGMNRRRAGEDFYFIQKLVPAGGYFYLNSTTVYPSPRISARVPFGTGASVGKQAAGPGNLFTTYNFQAFKELQIFFSMGEMIFSSKSDRIQELYKVLPEGLKLFINEAEWIRKINEIKDNTSGLSSFTKRFFGWFNMFRIVKYLNCVHQDVFEKIPVDVAAQELLIETDSSFQSKDPMQLLLHFRAIEKKRLI